MSPGECHAPRDVSAFISHRDAAQLLTKAVDVETLDFAILQGVSNNRYKRLALDKSRQLLGYKPQDDAFEILGI